MSCLSSPQTEQTSLPQRSVAQLPTVPLPATSILPTQLWNCLSPQQQQALFKLLTSICRNLLDKLASREEEEEYDQP